MNSECQASSVKTRVLMQYLGSAPPMRSCANKVLPLQCAMKSASKLSKCSFDILRLPSHHTESFVRSSTTVCLSFGERPV